MTFCFALAGSSRAGALTIPAKKLFEIVRQTGHRRPGKKLMVADSLRRTESAVPPVPGHHVVEPGFHDYGARRRRVENLVERVWPRLATLTPRRSRCDAAFHHGLLVPVSPRRRPVLCSSTYRRFHAAPSERGGAGKDRRRSVTGERFAHEFEI